MNLDSLEEMEHPAFLVAKEKEVILVFRDPQEPACRHRLQREPKETPAFQVLPKTLLVKLF